MQYVQRSARFALHLRGTSQQDDDFYVMINCDPDGAAFVLPERSWRKVLDTALAAPDDISEPGEEPVVSGRRYAVAGRSIVVLRCPPTG